MYSSWYYLEKDNVRAFCVHSSNDVILCRNNKYKIQKPIISLVLEVKFADNIIRIK